MSLTKDDILNFQDHDIVKVYVEQWNKGDVYLKSMSAKERAKIEKLVDDKAPASEVAVLMVGLSLCDEAGTRLLTSTEDLDKFSEKNMSIIERILVPEAMKVNKMRGTEDLEELKNE